VQAGGLSRMRGSDVHTASCWWVQVKIMKDFDPTGKRGPKTPLPDVVKVIEPKVCVHRKAQHCATPAPNVMCGCCARCTGWRVPPAHPEAIRCIDLRPLMCVHAQEDDVVGDKPYVSSALAM
jgi:hypothetical protein